MAEARVHMGSCGLDTVIRATVDDAYDVQLSIESECPTIQALGESLPPLNALDIGRTILGSAIYQIANDLVKHVSCAVPSAILRTVEVAAGIGLPSETRIDVRN